MTEDNIESLWRKVMNSSADNCPMKFAKALAAQAHAQGAREGREAMRAECVKVCDELEFGGEMVSRAMAAIERLP